LGKWEADDYGDIKQGDTVIEVHIPRGGAMTPEECDKSIAMAKEFFATYFPDCNYEYFTCHSWLLDPTLAELLPEQSNIVRFGKRYEIVKAYESDAIFRYVFRWGTVREGLSAVAADSDFSKKVKKCGMAGRVFYEPLGIFKK
jgi:hypothetical protein